MSDHLIYPFQLEFKNEKPYMASIPFYFNKSEVKGISCRISSLYAGDMKYDPQNPNRLRLFQELDLNQDHVYGLNQIHSHNVLEVDRDHPPLVEADGMITHDNSIYLSVTVADCLPVYLLDTQSGVFALVHSGWKGTGIVSNAIKMMRENHGSDPANITAIIGPCIGACCYKVDYPRAQAFYDKFGPLSVQKIKGEYFLDLKSANFVLLVNAGVKNIAVCADCTYTDERLGSFRRQGETYTRMAALIGRFD
jgi:YfiH family protein